MQLNLTFSSKKLVLPKRYEILERTAEESGVELSKFVRKIESANSHIETLLGKIHVGGLGQFQLFLGPSGSGKTTFLRTLPNFFQNITIISFGFKTSLDTILDEIGNRSHITTKKIFIIDERDNPDVAETEMRRFFERLRVLFRRPEGAVLIIWPITDVKLAEIIGRIASEVGGTSIAPIEGPIYNFTGLSKVEYFTVADETVRNLNNGESLDTFGVTKAQSQTLLTGTNTIGDYYAKLEDLAYKTNETSWKILEKKVKPKVWILLVGDSSVELDRTIRSLTQGIENRIDVDRMLAYLDDESNVSAYLNDWRERRASAGFLFRFLDVRLFSVSPNLALAAIRVFGSDAVKATINKKSEAKNLCLESVKRSGLYRSLINERDTSQKSENSTKIDTQHEYIRLQQISKTQDKELNKALAVAIDNALHSDKFADYTVKCEKRELSGTNLKPDIQIALADTNAVCLEVTWRSTGQAITGEVGPRQNTLSPGHIQKYVLEKTMEYIKELGI